MNVLWGDGLTPDQIKDITMRVDAGNRKRLVFGMGGGLLQKVNRDTLRFALKCSDVTDLHGQHRAIRKNPLDQTKVSKPGRFDLPEVFKNGIMTSSATFDDIRAKVAQSF